MWRICSKLLPAMLGHYKLKRSFVFNWFCCSNSSGMHKFANSFSFHNQCVNTQTCMCMIMLAICISLQATVLGHKKLLGTFFFKYVVRSTLICQQSSSWTKAWTHKKYQSMFIKYNVYLIRYSSRTLHIVKNIFFIYFVVSLVL